MTTNEIESFVADANKTMTNREKMRLAEYLIADAAQSIADDVYSRTARGKFLGDMITSSIQARNAAHHAWSCIAAYEHKRDQRIADGGDPDEVI